MEPTPYEAAPYEAAPYEPGTPCWLDLASADPAASRRFYGGLFGWTSYTLTIDTLDDYDVFTLGGVNGPTVAGMQRLTDPSQPSVWTCYFYAESVEEAARRVVAAGGRELLPPTEIAHLGRTGMYSDLEGWDFAVWQPHEVEGADVVGRPAAMCWTELAAYEAEPAESFYGAVFGWDAVRHGDRTTWRAGRRPVAGLIPMDDKRPGGWIPFFQVADCDAAVRDGVELGARVAVPPRDEAAGRFAAVVDPNGAWVTMIAPHGVGEGLPESG
ncbi:VOC family protein [Actinomadura sediminis]|uniref:VOC family protein n=1 Tax=Actinomadura sediminis TaxID=1038904 RepID=A0ABW3EJT7_9ACTN